ncbi:MAG: DNA polymerase III subunit chi [Magnetococcales bacterium]|nr:DNA polymerase III subunit chi [Magnetococcales bacterium]
MARSREGQPTARFYQLGATPLERALARIATKAFEKGLKSCVVAGDGHRAMHLDDLLWREPVDGFLPHGIHGRDEAERQPVLLSSTPQDMNGATVAILAAPIPLPDPQRFDLIIDFVDGDNPNALAMSRERYRHYRDRGCDMEYWIQTPDGAWKKK